MATKKAVIAFDDDHFIVYGDDKLLLSVPAAVVRKKSATPIAVAFGSDALKMRDDLTEGLMFSRPFKGNTISDLPAAKLMIRYYLKKLFGINTSVELYILVSSGISSIGRSKTEQAFISCGYKNIYIVERPYLLAKIAQQKGFNLAVDLEGRTVEAVLCEDGKVTQAHSINIGVKDVESSVTEELCAKYDLSPCLKKTESTGERCIILNTYAEAPILSCFSLSRDDYIVVDAIGLDIISGENKTIAVRSKELYPLVVRPYEKTVELMTALLMGCSEKTVGEIIRKGVLYLGEPTKINWFCEYMYKMTKLPACTANASFLQVKTLYGLLGDSSFLGYALGFGQ